MPLITLTSDFGRQDYQPGAAKGVLLQHLPEARLVDISHDLLPFNDPETAYVVRNAVKHFPPGTFHIVLANLFQHQPEHVLLVQHQQQYYCLADNGLITMILEETPEVVLALPLDRSVARLSLRMVDVMARAIKQVAAGVPIQSVGDASVSIHVRTPPRPYTTSQYIEGQIISIDHFENVIVNITHDEFEAERKGRRFKIVFKRDEVIDQLSETYADVPEGEKLALFNAAGYLEIAVNKGNAAGLFGLQSYSDRNIGQYTQSRLLYQTVRVYFE